MAEETGVLRQIVAAFGIEVDDKELHGLEEKINHVIGKLKEFGEILLGGFVGHALQSFIESQVQAATQLKHTADRLGLTTEELQIYNLAAAESGKSTDKVAAGLRHLNIIMGEAISGNGQANAAFAKLGISLKDSHGQVKSTGDVALEFAEKLGKVKTAAERTALSMKFLGRQGTLPTTQAIQEAIRDFEELGGGIDEDFIEKAEKAEKETARLRMGLESLKAKIAKELVPIFTAILHKFVDWTKAFISLAKHTNLLKTALMFIGVVAAWFALKGAIGSVLSLFAQFGPIILLIGALYLIFDDLYTMLTGGKSVIGDLIDKFYGVGTTAEVVAMLKGKWQDFLEYLRDAWPSIQSAAGAFLDFVISGLKSAWHLLSGIGAGIAGVIQSVEGMTKVVTGGGGAEDLRKKALESFKASGSEFAAAFTAEPPPVLKPRPEDFGGTGTRVPDVTQKNNVNINIHGVQDPEKAGRTAVRAFNNTSGEALRSAYEASSTGPEVD